ncbi:hypothetical protein LCGC14_1471720 [marine sediment metagenome]|uniref:Uncharacterized protein n=1 Tax=marine sediment metagenome TaxID=412755 RepID=A0A0F9JC58_9ZZZZ
MNDKKETMPGLHDGVHEDAEGPNRQTLKTPLRDSDEPTQEAKTPTEQKKAVREPHELQDEAWRLMDEAVAKGKMTLEDGTEVRLNADSLIRVIQWLASAKAKKPHFIPKPEDFRLKDTTGQKD